MQFDFYQEPYIQNRIEVENMDLEATKKGPSCDGPLKNRYGID